MKIIDLTTLSPDVYARLLQRPAAGSPAFRTAAASVCRMVQSEGDDAVRRLTLEYDSVSVTELRVPSDEITSARAQISPEFVDAVRTSIHNVTAFHKAQRQTEVSVETMSGVRCWRERRPIRRVGLYVPAGSAPLPSTLIMLGVPALLAGCREIAVCSPPGKDGSIHPAILATAAELGITEIYRIGGAQAVAALAFGTASVPKTDKIFGPGNAYVTAAKDYVSIDPEGVPIDLTAGPSEILIIADETADPLLIAADLLSQAEHDPSSQVVLVSTDRSVAEKTLACIEERLPSAPRSDIIRESLSKSYAVIAPSADRAIAFSNDYAPEHLSIQTKDPLTVAPLILNAGSVFLGRWAPVTAGDYASGTNHTLPTSGRAVSASGLSVESFCKTISFQSITEEGLRNLAPTLKVLSTTEALFEHDRAVDVRFR